MEPRAGLGLGARLGSGGFSFFHICTSEAEWPRAATLRQSPAQATREVSSTSRSGQIRKTVSSSGTATGKNGEVDGRDRSASNPRA